MTDLISVAELIDPPTHQRAIRLAHLHGYNLSQREIDRFLEEGVDVHQLHDPWMVLADRVVFGGEFFSFADMGVDGERAFTIMIIDDGGFIDIAAWRADRLAVWCGQGFALGQRQVTHRNALLPGLRVHRSPLDWLRAKRAGIVIIRPELAKVALEQVPLLIAEDEEHRRELQDTLDLDNSRIALWEEFVLVPFNMEAVS